MRPSSRKITAADLNFSLPDALLHSPLVGKPANDFNCKSVHNPIVMLHMLGANDQIDLNQLQYKLNGLGFCTFSKTYGAHSLAPWIGGVVPMVDSAKEVASFIKEVKAKTGAAKVDLVGHSEGAAMTLYVPLTQPGISDMIERVVALAPAVHGAKYFGLTDLAYLGGELTRQIAADILDVLGCEACDDLATGGRVYNDFVAAGAHIANPAIKTSIIMSASDTLVTPDVSRVDEPGARNLLVQNYCPADKVGHTGLAYDTGVWEMVVNELTENYNGSVACTQGLGI
ncbi:alpha/beta-hydrolase [Thozetella sp. PMI_491]|nr:alpha/beta-hydrolase [Thozetella sp. PMI_491]